jgi:hypothetical protein
MICIQCGAQNDDAISYCRQCGTNLQSVRSALLGVPPAPATPAVSPKLAPLVLISSVVFGILGFGALFGAIISILVIGSESQGRIQPDAFVALAVLLSITGTVGIVMIVRMLLRLVSVVSAAPSAPAPPRALPEPPREAALPPARQPASVVEHTTAHLPNYVRPRNTGE